MQRWFVRLTVTGLYIVLDCACIFLSVLLAYGTYQFFSLGRAVTYEIPLLAGIGLFMTAVVCSAIYLFGGYSKESGILNVKEIRNIILGVLTSFLIINAFFFSVRFLPSRYFVFLSFFYMLFTLPLMRSIIYSSLAGRMPGALTRRVLIYGAGDLGRRLYREINNSPRLHIEVCGFLDDDPSKKDLCITPCGFKVDKPCRVVGSGKDLPFLVKSMGIDEVYMAASAINNEKIQELFKMCRKLSVEIAFVPFLHDIFAHRVKLQRVGNLPLIQEQRILNPWDMDIAKRAMDLALCAFLAVFLLPLMVFIALVIKFDSHGPVFFKQTRVGKDGIHFNMYKFRSMFVDAPKYAVNPTTEEDPRITRVGRFLRKSSLDELPQIINVLKGEMSFVGPRPEMPFIVEEYNDFHRERLNSLPGITGLWQLSGDRKKAIHENMDYDLYYVYNRSFFLDVTILLQTLIFGFKGV